MGQLRNALRAQLFAGAEPAEALTQLNEFVMHMVPGAFATVIAARVDLASGRVEAASAGHLMPYLTESRPTAAAVPAPVKSLAVGVRGGTYAPSTFTIESGHGLVMFSDGLVERRGEAIDDGLTQLAGTIGRAGDASASSIWGAAAIGLH